MTAAWVAERDRLAWWVMAAALAVVLGFTIYSFLGTFVFGLFIYYATRPVYRHLRSHVRPPSLAAAVALFALTLPAILLAAYTLAVGLQETNRLLTSIDLGSIDAILRPYIDISAVVQNPRDLLDEPSVRAALQEFLDQALGYLGFIGNAALHLFVMFGIAFYLLRDDRRLVAWFRRRFADGDGVVEAYGRAVDRDFSNIFFGNILNAILTAVIGAVAYNLLEMAAPRSVLIPYPTLVGLLAGVASLVPVVGMKLVYVPVAVWLTYLAAIDGSDLLWFPAAFVVVSFVVVDTIPDFVLRPYVSGRGLHLGMVMFAYIFGPLLWGWYGIFLGPMLLVLVVHFVRLVLPELLAGRAIRPEAVGDALTTAHSEDFGETGGEVPADADDGDDADRPDAPGTASDG
ncbi:MAG: AI-2E family transporter [Halobacteriaceae archaeon]